MSTSLVVETSELSKSYGRVTAVDKLNLRVEEGEVFGFLGPNGAGKTTAILMLLGLTEPTSGLARVCGYNSTREPLKVKRIAGYLPEKVGFYEDLTALRNLRYTAELNGLFGESTSRRISELLEMVGLGEVADKKVSKFSRGMKQRLGIADVLVKDPKVVFLDEPTAGLDPQGMNQLLSLIVAMAKERHITVVLSSHQLHQVQRVCSRVGIMSKGRLVMEGTVEQLGREALAGGRVRIEAQVSQPTPQLLPALKKVRGVLAVETSGDRVFFSCENDLRSEIARAIIDSNTLLVQMKIQEFPLEEIYMKYFREEGV